MMHLTLTPLLNFSRRRVIMKHTVLLLVSLISMAFILNYCNSFDPVHESPTVTLKNPFAHMGDLHRQGLEYVKSQIKADPPLGFSEDILNDYIHSKSVEFMIQSGYSEAQHVDLSDIISINLESGTDRLCREGDGGFEDILVNIDLTDEERELFADLAYMIQKCDTNDVVFSELTNDLIARTLSLLPEENYEKIFTTIAVAIDSRDYWRLEESMEDWLYTLYPVICEAAGLDPDDYDPGEVINEYTDCASLANIAGTDAGGAVVGAIGGPAGAGIGAVGASSALIVGCAVSAVLEWILPF